MTDAISRSALMQALMPYSFSEETENNETAYWAAYDVVDFVYKAVKNAPALDVAPVVHARWIPYDEARPGMYFSHRCSKCGGSVEHAYLMRPSSFSDFCPNCGARMDGEAE